MRESLSEEQIREISQKEGNQLSDFFMLLLKIDKRVNPELYQTTPGSTR